MSFKGDSVGDCLDHMGIVRLGLSEKVLSEFPNGLRIVSSQANLCKDLCKVAVYTRHLLLHLRCTF